MCSATLHSKSFMKKGPAEGMGSGISKVMVTAEKNELCKGGKKL